METLCMIRKVKNESKIRKEISYMLVLVYRKCSTCQKALKWLEENQVEFTERAIVEENPTFEELK